MRLLLLFGLALVASRALAADVLAIDKFDYADVNTARAAWAPVEGSEPAELMPAPGGGQALRIPCDYTRPEARRAGYDRKVDLDLSRYGTIEFDFYCDDTDPISYCSIYFHSVDGWYSGSFPILKGWTHAKLSKASFHTEDKPAGWAKVDTIRISTWPAVRAKTYCAIANLIARSEDIAVVQGAAGGGETDLARYAQVIGDGLERMNVPFGGMTEEEVAAGNLAGKKLAIFAFSPAMKDETAAEVEKFVAAGGKVILFYSIHPKVAALLGITSLNWAAAGPNRQFMDVIFDTKAVPGLPEKMRQDSWNADIPTLAATGRAIGTWADKDGKPGGAAVVLSDNGAYMGHVLTEGDAEAKTQFLVALVGHFVPSAWQDAATGALSKASRIGPFADRDALDAWLKTRPQDAPYRAAMAAKLTAAAEAQQRAAGLLQEKRYADVIKEAALMRGDLTDAYVLAHTPRDGEFRAVWNHSGTGDCGTWDEAMKRLAAANFNAVVPNMWWGGLAYYKSKLLPVAAWVQEKGDPIEQAVAAGKKYGVQVHPWKVNWNLANAPQDFYDRMRAEKRVMIGHKGDERKWLCPSNEANFELERDTMLEVVRNYDVGGVHFDYIRYPDEDGCFCDTCRAAFEKARGKAVANWPEDCWSGPLKQEYRDWRCTNITRLVRAVSEEAHRLKPYIKISAAVFGDYPGCKDGVGQDWVLWCRNGWLDFVCPMDYADSDVRFRNLITNQVGLVGGRVPIYSGIGQFIMPDDQVVGQMEISRACGSDGFILFNMGTALAEQGLPKYALGATSAKALLPHEAPPIQFKSTADNDRPIVGVAGDKLTIETTLASLGAHRKQATGATGDIELQDLDGNRLAKLGELPGVGKSASFDIARREGVFRVAAVGELTFADGSKARFIRRGRPYEFGGK